MDVLKTLENFDSSIKEAESIIKSLKNKRIEWCRQNNKEIKKLFPIKNKIYQIIELPDEYPFRDLEDDVYYFRPKNIIFNPANQFNYINEVYPFVKGQVLDYNLKEVERSYGHSEICITNIKEIEYSDSLDKKSNLFTKVYVMIDKNTGYYKIGRSKNPLRRERTLQSEKPTIEMLFNYDARVKDEKLLHDIFKQKRVRGEWFDLNGSDLIKIREYFDFN